MLNYKDTTHEQILRNTQKTFIAISTTFTESKYNTNIISHLQNIESKNSHTFVNN